MLRNYNYIGIRWAKELPEQWSGRSSYPHSEFDHPITICGILVNWNRRRSHFSPNVLRRVPFNNFLLYSSLSFAWNLAELLVTLWKHTRSPPLGELQLASRRYAKCTALIVLRHFTSSFSFQPTRPQLQPCARSNSTTAATLWSNDKVSKPGSAQSMHVDAIGCYECLVFSSISLMRNGVCFYDVLWLTADNAIGLLSSSCCIRSMRIKCQARSWSQALFSNALRCVSISTVSAQLLHRPYIDLY